MRIPDKMYDVLKWISIIAIPALITFLAVVLPVFKVSVDIVNAITTILAAVATLIGTLIGISTSEYNKKK